MKTYIFSKNRILISTTILFSILSIMSSCTKPADNQGTPATNEVWIQGMAFDPATITVTSGTTITWTNKDGFAHTVTSNTGLFNSGSISNNGTYPHTFNTVGIFPYKCTIHPQMTATVVVN
jgi:plastocyanin